MKGPKYRETKPINFKNATKLSAIDFCIEKMATRKKITLNELIRWQKSNL